MAVAKSEKKVVEVLFVRAEIAGIHEKSLLKSRHIVQVDMVWPRAGIARKSVAREAVFRRMARQARRARRISRTVGHR